MLRKIVSITKIGRFRHCVSAGDTEFRRATLVFAENGAGKTTLCDLLRSLQSGDASFIQGRRSLGVEGEPAAEVRLDDRNAIFRQGRWDTTVPGIAIFDTRFVHDNVYAGEAIAHQHKKNLYDVIIGAEGVRLAERIRALDDDIRRLNRQLGEQELALGALLPQGMRLDLFLALETQPDLDQRIETVRREVAALRKSAELLAKPLPIRLGLPQPPPGLETILPRSIAEVAADVEEAVHQHLGQHHKEPDERWMARGVGLVRSNACPFCGQALAASRIFPSLSTFFSEAYRALRTAADELAGMTERFATAQELEHLQLQVERNDDLCSYWSQFVDSVETTLDVAGVLQTVRTLRDLARELATRKKSHPLEVIEVPPELHEALAAYAVARQSVTEYNERLITMLGRIQEKKAELDPQRLAAAEAVLGRLEATRIRFSPAATTRCEEYLAARREKDRVELAKQEVRRELDRHTGTVFRRYETTINDLLYKFGTGFKIQNTAGRHVGGTPSATFQIAINDYPVDIGDADTPLDRPSFKNTLSAGDRSALALAFFLAQLARDPDLEAKIVVLDDPFSSQDRARRTCTQSEIARLAEKAQQVVVLSHDPHFLKGVAEFMRDANPRMLQVSHFGNDALIVEWNATEECLEQHAKDHRTLLAYRDGSMGDPLIVHTRLRPLLENYLFIKLPDQFPERASLGNMIAAIREAEPNDPKAAAQTILDELETINEYSLQPHHRTRGQGQLLDSDAELRAFADRALRLVRGFPTPQSD